MRFYRSFWLYRRRLLSRLQYLTAPVFIIYCDILHTFMGVQVTTTVDNEVLELLDEAAKQENISRSKLISQVLSHWVHSKSEVKHMGEILKEKEDMIAQLRADKSFLEGHIHSLMAERDRLLPAPGSGVGFWSRLFGRKPA